MILGIGTDILEINHFKQTIRKTPVILQRIFTKNELEIAKKITSQQKKLTYFAKRFAAKEAVSKACGTGITVNISWKDIEITNTPEGMPVVKMSTKTKNFLQKKYKNKNLKILLSLSDEKSNAIAFAILTTKK